MAESFQKDRQSLKSIACPAQPEPFGKKFLRFAGISLMVSLFLELVVFNYASYLLIGGKYIPYTIALSDTAITGMVPDPDLPDTYIAISESPEIEISGLQQHIRTLYVDAETQKPSHYKLNIALKYTDSTHSSYYSSPKTMELISGLERTKYADCAYYGETGSLKLTFDAYMGEELQIRGIGINQTIPFNISVVRVLLLLLLSCAVYALLKAPSFGIPFSPANPIHLESLLLSVFTFILLISGVFCLYSGTNGDPFKQTRGDQVSQELVDAFENGQVYLLSVPSDELLSMDNPYDRTARDNQEINFKWDHLLYNGKYYSYYGIAPVILVFMPYHMLTGYYLPSCLACLLFCMISAVFVSLAYLKMIANWFRETPFRLVLAGLIILLMSCGLLLCVCRAMFYEMEEAAGLMFFSMGVYALFSSGIMTEGKIILSRLTLSSLCISLAVLSRPMFVWYAVAALFWLGYGMRQYRGEHGQKADRIRYLAAVLLPYVLLGGIQMIYNFLRFGSPLDYGIQYSLTINDFTQAEFYPKLAFICLWNLLFSVPVVKSIFPFFIGNFDDWGLNGYFFAETTFTFGLLWRALPLFSYGYAPTLLRRFDREKRVRTLFLCALPGLLVPLMQMLLTWESGYALRYTVDFAFSMLLLAFALIWYVYNQMKNKQLKQYLGNILIACMVFSILANIALVFQYIPGVSNTGLRNREATILYYRIARLLEFWN